jgi:creatinine amidohydrolase/Fe(II)-dependent formamide hydrolase-like protein
VFACASTRFPWTRVADLDLAHTAVFILSGPLEQHGPHLPLSADLFQAAFVRDAELPMYDALHAWCEKEAAKGW